MAKDSQAAGQDFVARKSQPHAVRHFGAQKMSHHDHTKQFPALLPGPPRTLPAQSSMSVSRPKKNSTACLACKAAKRKCSGPPSPCKACLSDDAESNCHFDPSRDLRRKVGVKRTIQELTDYKDLFDSLLSTIRSAQHDKVVKLVELIKNNGSMGDIALAVGSDGTRFTEPKFLTAMGHQTIAEDVDQHIDSLIETFNPPFHRDSAPNQGSTSPEEHPMELPRAAFDPYARVTLENLCYSPLFTVPAKPWTEVTDDNDLVSHLVSLYFTWDHPCAQFVDQGIFLEHMKMGNLNSEFCSPLLVNSLLSMASVYSDSPGVFSDLGNVFSRGQSFFDEAERLLKPQEGLPSLTNIQALLMMCCVLSYQGKTSRAWWILRGAVQLAQDMDLFSSPQKAHPSGEAMSPEMERVRAITAWGIFGLNLQLSMKLRKFTNLARPASRLTVGGNEDFEWTPYPRSNQITYATKPAHLPQVRQGLAELTDIMVHVQEVLHVEGLHDSFHELMTKAEGPYKRLQKWLRTWPDATQIGREPISQLLILRIQCLQAIMNLVERLIDRDQEGAMSQQLQRTWCEQAEGMAECLRIHRQSYGLKHVPSQVADAVQTALRTLVHQLDVTGNAKHAFIELCRFGIVLSQKFQPTAETVRAIQLLSQRGAVRLPTEAVAILDGSELSKAQEW
ncbi:uncharacterized protein N7482_001966 [Penicillium canariense]|uniref:Zn(2)-C6 fungal-type domain-containing protein n=1 Tax=Penicillium canariense TaxID=189055 RepID=A0A9W9LUE4_9EURO|nr:uncharacterized protein N7482_001966 [Penicillium canariense]KAJ5176089.1 hypothetical protein N7482_001966 [Penicillium canariense]